MINKIKNNIVRKWNYGNYSSRNYNGHTQGFTDNYIKVHIEENISIQNTIVSVLLKKNNGSHMEGEII